MGILLGTVERIIIALSAEPRVFPGKSADHTGIHPLPVHGLEKLFQACYAGLRLLVYDPKPFISLAEEMAVLPNLLWEKMGVRVNNHEFFLFLPPA